MNRQSIIGLLPLFALGACAQTHSGSTQEYAEAPLEAMVEIEEAAAFQTVQLSIIGMT